MIFNASGGGIPLNFSVRAYDTEAALLAATPRANTIGIVTTTKITGWYFSSTEPETAEEGMVWIVTGASSAVEFNALKKNGIRICPILAKQYISGAWVQVPAKSYKNGTWVSWLTYLYVNGDECTSLTGGWVSQHHKQGTAGTMTKQTDSIQLTCTANQYANTIEARTSNAIDFTDIDLLVIQVSSRSGMACANNYWGVYAFLSSSADAGQFGGQQTYHVAIEDAGEKTIDLTNCSGEYYVIVACYGASVAFTEITGE